MTDTTTGWTAQPREIGAITLFVADLSHAKAYYQRVFDLPVVYEDANSAVFRFGPTVINLLVRTAAEDLVRPAAVGAAGDGAQFVFTLGVAEVDAAVTDLAARGVELINGPMDRPWGIRTASFADPDGHIWELAQDLP